MIGAILRRLLGLPVPADGPRPVAEIPGEAKRAQEAETREYLERARAAAALARIQSKEEV